MATEFYNRNWRMPKSSNSSKVSNYSMQFNGTDEYVEISDSTLLNGKTAVTISMWINPSLQGIYDAPLNYYSFANGGNNKIGFAYPASTGNYLRFTLQTSSALAYVDSSTNSIPLNQWTHIVGVGEAGQALKIYINGVEDSATQSGTMPTLYQDANLFIGKDNGAAARNFNGKIDHVAIFDYALSASQVTSLYGSSTDGVGNPMAITGGRKPIAYYPIGDYAAFNGSEYLVNNGALQDYVFAFEALNDVVSFGDVDLGPNNFTFSFWFKHIDEDNTYGLVAGKTGVIEVYNFKTQNRFFGYVYNDSGGSAYFDTGDLTNENFHNWNLISIVYDGSNVSLYVNGVSSITPVSLTGLIPNNSNNLELKGKSSTQNWQLSNISLFDTNLPATGTESITSLYNYGTPPNIASYSNLQGWWKLDASATFDGSNWSIPDDSSNSNTGTSSGMTAANLVQSNLLITQPYSRFALDFDGTNDKITLNSSISTGNNYSVSFWLNPSTTGPGMSNSYIFSDSTTSPFKGLALDQGSFTAGGFGNFYYYTGAVNIVNNTAILGNVWSNIVITFDVTGQEIKFYVNGVLDKTSTSVANIGTLINEFGIRSSGNPYNGNLSNISIWNTELSAAQVTEIYNQGKPSNLNTHSAYSNLTNWYQLGENSSFNTNWTVLDEKGTNNGTSANMTEADLVNGVGTSANGLSDGMGGADNIIGDAPYSTANAVSYGMGVEAKSTSVPS